MKWFLLAYLLTGQPTGPVGITALVGGWPVPFDDHAACMKASVDQSVIGALYGASRKINDIALFCVEGAVRKAGP